jgi:hypothetical protein
MIERPILFSAPMVRAILDKKKTQTRRVVKFSGWPDEESQQDKHRIYKAVFRCDDGSFGWLSGEDTDGKFSAHLKPYPGTQCPYGTPGDRIWVRETWRDTNTFGIQYRADFEETEVMHGGKWRPSIFMPRGACRLTLEVTGVRVERLQDITDDAACCEGVDLTNTSIPTYATQRFQKLWDSINAKRGFGWEVNPWVWVVEFRSLS